MRHKTTKRTRRRCYLASLLLVPLCCVAFFVAGGPPCLGAQVPRVRATVDTTQTNLNTPIQLSVTTAEGNATVDTSPIKDFKILSQSSSSSVQIINGQMTSKRTQSYTLLPLRTGTLTIPALAVTVNGKTAHTTPITVQVTRGAVSGVGAADVKVTGSISNPAPYLGQQIVYTFRLLYNTQITNTDYEAPSFDGFSATQIGKETSGEQIVNGRRYQEVVISYLLVPLKTGALTIDPAELQCDVVRQSHNSGSPFDSFFNNSFFGGSQLVAKVFRTDTVTVKVRPLPAWTGSDSFSGLVGQFDLKTRLETHKATVGQSITLSVTLAGKGNLRDADTPHVHIPDAFRQYADQPQTDVALGPAGYSGKKVFKTALVPVKPGTYTLTTSPVVYFNPAKKAYQRLAPKPLSITVLKSATPTEMPTIYTAQNAENAGSSVQKQKVDITGRDILSIKTGLGALSDQRALPTLGFVGLLLAPGVIFLLLFGVLALTKQDDRPAARMARKAQRALKAATAGDGGNAAELLSNLYRALIYAVFARARTLGESLTQSEAEALLNQHGVNPETAAGILQLLGKLESARYGNDALTKERQGALISETGRAVKGLIR